MVAKEIRRDFEYKDAQLPSGVKVSGKVITKDGKLYSTNGEIRVKYPDDRLFTFKLYQEDRVDPMHNEEASMDFSSLVKNSMGVKEGMDDNAVIEEFKAFLKQDVSLID